MARRRVRLVALALVSTMLLVAGCGDDDDSDGAAAGGDIEQFCDDAIAINKLEPDVPEDATEEEAAQVQEDFVTKDFIPLGRRIEENAPDDLKADVREIIDLFAQEGPAAFEDPRTGELAASIDRRAAEPCDAELIEVTAVDYSFQGVPSEIDAGRVVIHLSNDGEELHEFLMFRKKAGVTESFDELLALPEGEGESKADEAGAAFSFPGSAGSTIVELAAGDYVAVCFIPKGLTPAAIESGEEPDGPPHFTQGMKVEFTVS